MLLPKLGAREILKKALANGLIAAAEERLIECVDPSAPEPEISDIASWATRIRSFLKAGFATILPLFIIIIAVWIFREVLPDFCSGGNRATDAEICNLLRLTIINTILYASVWFVLNLASLIDPKADARATSAVDIGGNLSKSLQQAK